MENAWACVLGSWPRAFLSLASRVSVLRKAVLGLGLGFFCVLGLEPCVLDSPSNKLYKHIMCVKSNLSLYSLYYAVTPKRATSLRGPSTHHCARATQLLSKKCRNGGEPLATLSDLNLRSPTTETNALPHDQMAGTNCV